MAFADGEFGAELFCIAPKLEQADLVFSAFKFAVSQEPALDKRMAPRKYDLFIKESNTTVKKVAFNEKKADGFNPHCVIGDEFSSWPGDRGLKQYNVMTSGMGAREQPMILMISSGGYENEGIYDDLVKRGTSFLLGNSRETRLLPIFYMIDDLKRWDDINELRKSCPGLGVSVSTQWMLDEIAKAYESPAAKAEFLTKICCVKQSSSQAWLKAEWIEASCGEQLTLEDMRGCYCIGGIDLSMTTDLTSCCIVVEKDGKLHVFSKFWLPANRIREAEARDGLPYTLYAQRGLISPSGENVVDTMDCFAWFRSLIEEHEIYPLAVGYDHYMALPLVQAMKGYGFKMSDVRQGDNLTPVINEVEGLFADGRFDIGDNALLKVHLLDSALKINADNNRRQLVKLNSKCHIDGMAALLDAMCVRQCFNDEIGEQLKNEVS